MHRIHIPRHRFLAAPLAALGRSATPCGSGPARPDRRGAAGPGRAALPLRIAPHQSRAPPSLLLGLRVIVLVLILFLLGLQPVYARTHTEELPGRVLVAVDRSDSMDVTDPQRPAVEKLRLALALKVAGDICPDAQLHDWIKQYDDDGDVRRWVADDEFADDAEKRRQRGGRAPRASSPRSAAASMA